MRYKTYICQKRFVFHVYLYFCTSLLSITNEIKGVRVSLRHIRHHNKGGGERRKNAAKYINISSCTTVKGSAVDLIWIMCYRCISCVGCATFGFGTHIIQGKSLLQDPFLKHKFDFRTPILLMGRT